VIAAQQLRRRGVRIRVAAMLEEAMRHEQPQHAVQRIGVSPAPAGEL